MKSGKPAIKPSELHTTLGLGQKKTLSLAVKNEGNGVFSYRLLEMPAGFAPAQTQQFANAPQKNNEVAPVSNRANVLALSDPLFQLDASAKTGHALLLGVEWAMGAWWMTSGGAGAWMNPILCSNWTRMATSSIAGSRVRPPTGAGAIWRSMGHSSMGVIPTPSSRSILRPAHRPASSFHAR